MAIDYITVRRKSDREVIGIIDSAKSIIWHTLYYGVGDFEVYAPATDTHIDLLKEGYYVQRPDNAELGIIESVEVINSVQDGSMIIASGRLAKSILDRRQIYKLSGTVNTPTILRGNVEAAIRTVVSNNAISCSFDSDRNIAALELGASAGTTEIIVDDSGTATAKQVSYSNLLTYTDSVLEEYKLSSRIIIDEDTKKLQFVVYKGVDRSMDNTDGNAPVIFSAEFDNLTESNYLLNTANAKNAILIGGEGEGLSRFYSLLVGTETGLQRRETWLDASSISKTYEQGQTYTDAEYKAILDAQGKQTLAALVAEETFDGTLNASGGVWRLNEDYKLGDIVTIQDNQLGIYANVRITEITEAQDESGYTITPAFEVEEATASNLSVLTTESSTPLLTQAASSIVTEDSQATAEEGVKISELPTASSIDDSSYIPIVTDDETKKVTVETLKEEIAGADYIIEQGTSGSWIYKKWNSGILECWGSITVTDSSSTWGNVYRRGVANSVRFPFDFVATPIINATFCGLNGNGWLTSYVEDTNGLTTNQYTGSFQIIAGTAGNCGGQVNIFAIGKWK